MYFIQLSIDHDNAQKKGFIPVLMDFPSKKTNPVYFCHDVIEYH
jgi:hypothetical protein